MGRMRLRPEIPSRDRRQSILPPSMAEVRGSSPTSMVTWVMYWRPGWSLWFPSPSGRTLREAPAPDGRGTAEHPAPEAMGGGMAVARQASGSSSARSRRRLPASISARLSPRPTRRLTMASRPGRGPPRTVEGGIRRSAAQPASTLGQPSRVPDDMPEPAFSPRDCRQILSLSSRFARRCAAIGRRPDPRGARRRERLRLPFRGAQTSLILRERVPLARTLTTDAGGGGRMTEIWRSWGALSDAAAGPGGPAPEGLGGSAGAG